MLVAVTGGPADGKSTILGFAAEMGVATTSADAIVDGLYKEAGFAEALGQNLGQEFVSNGQVDKRALREAAFEGLKFRRKLNSLVHAEVMRRILDWGRSQPGHALAEVPLLIEGSCQGWFDRVWVADAGPEERMRRLNDRFEGDEAKAQALLAAQLPTEAKAAFADVLYRTNLPFDTVRLRVSQAVERLG